MRLWAAGCGLRAAGCGLRAAGRNRIKGWRFVGTGDPGGALSHWSFNLWDVRNEPAGTIILNDPIYGYARAFQAFAGTKKGARYTLAFAEGSNGVFAVFERV